MAEVELKFDIAARDIPRLVRARALAAVAPRTRSMFALYFDTPDEELRAHAMALRLRREGKHWVQTLKGGGAVTGGLHARDEWECDSPDGSLDLARFRETPLAALPGARELHRRLRVHFQVEVERTTWLVKPARGVALEVALDRGCVRRDRNTDAVSEVEIESKRGPTAALFELAHALLGEVALVPSAVSKAQRGYRLARGETLGPVRAQRPDLSSGTSAAAAAAAALSAALAQLLANAEGVRASDDPEFVHQLRVALRRARSALRVFRAALGRAAVEPARDPLRWITRVAGRVRDLDVFATATLPAMARDARIPVDDAALAARLHRARIQARQQLVAALRSRRYALAVLELARIAREAGGTEAPPAREYAAKRLRKALRALLRDARGLDALDAHRRHLVRIRAKRLRYALDACASLFPAKRVKPFASALSELQDALGDANDARVGRALLAELRVPRALAGTGVAALDQAEARATRRALPALERLRAAPKPWGKG